MQNFVVLAIIVVAIAVAALAGRAAWLRGRSSVGPKAGGGAQMGGRRGAAAQGELVAVIAAAVAAASGMEPEGFRIVGIRGSSGARGSAEDVSPFAQRGLNTPAWGHVDRFIRGE